MKKPRLSKRPHPKEDLLQRRAELLRQIAAIARPTITADSHEPLLEYGNSKLGREGRFAKTVLVWNLPAMMTCPGASTWCSTHCYNADERTEKFPLDRWRANLAWFNERPAGLKAVILKHIDRAGAPIAFRIHSSGDFFSNEYIKFWTSLCRGCPHVQFWAYTRSWQVSKLAESLQELRELPNIEVFASWDETMPSPPTHWRLSTVLLEGKRRSHGDKSTLQCPEEAGGVPSCADCGYCFFRRPGHVNFALH